MTRTLLGAVVAVALGSLGWCLLLDDILGHQHVLAVELSALSLAALWAGLTIRELVSWHHVAIELAADAEDVVLFGVPCSLTSRLGADALVLGPIRPRIFVGRSLARALTEDELRAVIYHEDHHRRTLAPVRAAALAAWLRLFGRSTRIRMVVLERLSQLEVLADADAIRRGSTPRSLARALLKGDPAVQPISFSYAADERVERLLDHAAGLPAGGSERLPYEWLPTALLAICTLGCHAII
jgi:hypothetical protein